MEPTITPTPVREQPINGETVLVINPALVLVASQTEPGAWHAVEVLCGAPEPNHCTCAGFLHRGRCRHIEAVRALCLEVPVRVASPTPERIAERILTYFVGPERVAPEPIAPAPAPSAFFAALDGRQTVAFLNQD